MKEYLLHLYFSYPALAITCIGIGLFLDSVGYPPELQRGFGVQLILIGVDAMLWGLRK